MLKSSFDSGPIQIWTDAAEGSGDSVYIHFIDPSNPNRMVFIKFQFSDPPTYTLGYCVGSAEFTMPPAGSDNVRLWTIRREDDKIRLLCNGVQIFAVGYRSSDQQGCDWWQRDYRKIYFSKFDNDASDVYTFRLYPDGELIIVFFSFMLGYPLYLPAELIICVLRNSLLLLSSATLTTVQSCISL